MRQLLTCALFWVLAPFSLADDSKWFVAFKGAIGEASIKDISARDIGTGVVIDGILDGEMRDDHLVDYPIIVGLAVGRRLGRWHLEGEYAWRYRSDWDNRFSTSGIRTITNVFANVETSNAMLNLVRRGSFSRRWFWELGVGAGYVAHNVDSDYVEREVPNVAPELIFSSSTRETGLAYNVLAGVTRTLGEAWTVNVRYRYFDLGDMTTGPFQSSDGFRPGRLHADHCSHEVHVSFELDL